MNDGAIEALDELRKDSRLCKNRHFAASDRKRRYHIYCGIPVIVMTVFTGTVLVNYLSKDNPPSWAVPLTTILAFLAATLSSLQTFFNFHKAAEGHRAVANRYQDISRRSKHLINKHNDIELNPKSVWNMIDEIRQDYAKINQEAEAFPTCDRDLEFARKRVSLTPFKQCRDRRAEHRGSVDAAAHRD